MKYISIPFYIILLFSNLNAAEIKQNNDSGFVKKQNQLIITHFTHKKYFDCIAETGRLLQYNADKSLLPDYTYFISLNYFLGGQYATVADRTSRPDSQQNLRNALLHSRSLVHLGNINKAIAAMHKIPYEAFDIKYRYDFFIRKAELLVLSDRYGDTLDEISRYEKVSPVTDEINSLRKDISRYRSLNRKSAAISVMLSAIIPGTGQAYCGRYSEALLSFTAVALSGAGTWYAMDRGEKSLGMTLGFFTVLLYSGNLYGAYNSAQSFNRHLYNSFRSDIISTHVPDYDPMTFIDMKKVFK